MVTRAQNQNHKPKLYTDGTTRYLQPQALTTTIASAETEPICVTSAIKSPAWRKAMTEKFNALLNSFGPFNIFHESCWLKMGISDQTQIGWKCRSL